MQQRRRDREADSRDGTMLTVSRACCRKVRVREIEIEVGRKYLISGASSDHQVQGPRRHRVWPEGTTLAQCSLAAALQASFRTSNLEGLIKRYIFEPVVNMMSLDEHPS
jgi:hypothetical protein